MNNLALEKNTTLTRRTFIVGSAALAGGGLALGMNVPFGVGSANAQGAVTELNIWSRSSPTIPA
jgi:isoquinoline 1-oxidoreductase subunit beta